MSRFKLSALALVVAVGGFAQQASAAPCVTFQGLEHCPVAGSTVAIVGGQLVVTPASDGFGGVSIATPDATSWKGTSKIQSTAVGDRQRAKSISDDVVTSTSDAIRTPNSFRLSATFSASANPTYTVQVLRDGRSQGTASKIASGATGATLGWKLDWPTEAPEFVVMPGGRCSWSYQTVQGADISITLPDGRVLLGDEVKFTEEVNPQGAYPYLTFDKLVFEGDFQKLQFSAESVQ